VSPLVKVAAMMRIARIIAGITGTEAVADFRETHAPFERKKAVHPERTRTLPGTETTGRLPWRPPTRPSRLG
jgi:hypothetical protein